MSKAVEDRRIALINACNAITEGHFTDGGHYRSGYENIAHSCLILAADYARWALEPRRATAKRVCDLMRAQQEIGRSYSNEDTDSDVDSTERETVLNAISFALSLVCERIDARESKARARQ